MHTLVQNTQTTKRPANPDCPPKQACMHAHDNTLFFSYENMCMIVTIRLLSSSHQYHPIDSVSSTRDESIM